MNREGVNYTDLYTTIPRHIEQNNREMNNVFFCNLYTCIKKVSSYDFKKDSDNTSIMDSMSMIYGDVGGTNIITISGDWGIYKDGSEYVGQGASKQSRVTIPELDSVLDSFDNWFCPHLEEDIHEKIYPIPINVFAPDWQKLVSKNIEELRKIKKDNLCYANFSMTSLYRTTLAKWIPTQDYIDYLFPVEEVLNVEPADVEPADGEWCERKEHNLSLEEFAMALASYKFAIAPVGNGVDTYRLWECILTNTVPIVQDTFCNRVFSKIWPMITVRRYELDNIQQKMSDFYKKHGDYIEYDYSLLLKKNFNKLLERLKYESNRVRQERVQMKPVEKIVIKF